MTHVTNQTDKSGSEQLLIALAQHMSRPAYLAHTVAGLCGLGCLIFQPQAGHRHRNTRARRQAATPNGRGTSACKAHGTAGEADAIVEELASGAKGAIAAVVSLVVQTREAVGAAAAVEATGGAEASARGQRPTRQLAWVAGQVIGVVGTAVADRYDAGARTV